MEPALDVVNRALQGDYGARSFLERTTSLYVLDVIDTTNPKTYGCWNFIHQAMNEVERYEANYLSQHLNGNNLSSHVRMLAAMALRVARRGPASDRALVITCIANATQYNGSDDQSQWLVDLNLELREIVMGRIAAMAFDFTFHKRSWPHGKSAFADNVALDTFCAVLSANAVSSGPKAIEAFATEWIIPSSKNLPTFAVVSVVFHLASEGMRKSSPAGTKDLLQQLSFPIISIVLVPTLSDAVTMNQEETNGMSLREENSQIAAMALRAMKVWCDATDLSLPLIKHICSKVNINVVEVLSDAMYSDSSIVIDVLADFIEATALVSDEKIMSDGRMSQVKHIIQPDIASFHTQVTGQQLKIIESREMLAIIDDLMSAIGLQRFRFTERQNKGDFDVCRNLARIASSVCQTWFHAMTPCDLIQTREPDGGAVEILLKGANHPSINVCAICLEILTRMMSLVPSLPLKLLPVLQRRAIIPHQLMGGQIILDSPDLFGVALSDILSFRQVILSEALQSCWNKNNEHYMDSCTSAIEEFCSESSSTDVSLQTEAALFCIGQIAFKTQSRDKAPSENTMERLVKALLTKPPSLMANPLTRESLCRFIRKYSHWFIANQMQDAALNLLMASFHETLRPSQNFPNIEKVYIDGQKSYVREASHTLKALLYQNPIAFTEPSRLAQLMVLWETISTVPEDFRFVYIGDRIDVCSGIGLVVATLPANERIKICENMMHIPLKRLEHWTVASQQQLAKSLKYLGDAITLVASIFHTFAYPSAAIVRNIAGKVESKLKGECVPAVALTFIRNAWSHVTIAATLWCDNENVASGLSAFLQNILPPSCDTEIKLQLIKELCQLAILVLQNTYTATKVGIEMEFSFMRKLFNLYGDFVEQSNDEARGNKSVFSDEIATMLKSMIWKVAETVQDHLGHVWISPIQCSEQGNGQSASEIKSFPTTKKTPVKQSNIDLLPCMLSLLTQSIDSCPTFTLKMPALPTATNDKAHDGHDKLIRRATNSAIALLNEHDECGTVRCAILFLLSLVQYTNKVQFQQYNHNATTEYDLQWMTHLYPEIICKIMIGACGKYEYEILDTVSELLVLLLQGIYMNTNNGTKLSIVEMELYVFSSIRQQYDQIFLCGDHARQVIQQVLFYYAAMSTTLSSSNAARSRQISCDQSNDDDHDDDSDIIMSSVLLQEQSNSIYDAVTVFIEDVWQLHQIEDPTVLSASDAVHYFIAKYRNISSA